MKMNRDMALALLGPHFTTRLEQEREHLLIAVVASNGTTDDITRMVTGNKKAPWEQADAPHRWRVREQLKNLQADGYARTTGGAGWAGSRWAIMSKGQDILNDSFDYKLLLKCSEGA